MISKERENNMYYALNPATAGAGLPLRDFCRLAGEAGFKGVEFSIAEANMILEQESLDSLVEIFESNGVLPACFGIPIDWRNDESVWKDGLKILPKLSEAALKLGCKRTCTYILPSSEIPFEENWEFHVNRLRPIGKIFSDYGISMGLEFVGPKTMRTGSHDFIYTLEDALELSGECYGAGVLLDSFHWFTTQLDPKDILDLNANQIVHVHINDAPDMPIDEQMDSVRLLPGEGIIDLEGFLQALREINYKGPVAVETFDENLRQMTPEKAAKKAFDAVDRVWNLAKLK
ncbi:MAG: sugar phosphate isomerase/epimerase family protein [Armatimonadota bacterium]